MDWLKWIFPFFFPIRHVFGTHVTPKPVLVALDTLLPSLLNWSCWVSFFMEYSLHVLWIIRRGDFHVFERISIASKTAYGSASTPRVCWGPKGAPASRPKHLSRLYLNQSISQTPSRNSHLWIKHLSEQLQQNFTSKSSTSAVWHPIWSGLKTKRRKEGKKQRTVGEVC